MMNIGLKHTISYIFVTLSSIFFTSMIPFQSYQLDQSASINTPISKEQKIEISKSCENDQNLYFSQSPTQNKQNTYRRCYQANSLVQEVNVFTLMYYTCFSDTQSESEINTRIESYFTRIRNIEISLPISILVYPFNYFW